MTNSTSLEHPIPDDVPTDPVAYDKWFRAEVQAALDDPRPGIPHEQAMAEIRARLDAARKKKDAGNQ